MKRRTALLFVAAAAFFAALAGSSYAAWVWTNDGPDSAEATPAVVGVCDVSVSNLPDGVRAAPLAVPALAGDRNTPGHMSIHLLLWVPLSPDQPLFEDDPVSGFDRNPTSRVGIEPTSGEIVFESYRTGVEEEMLQEALKTLQIGPWELAGDSWPRTDTPPTKEPLKPTDGTTSIEYTPPSSASGLIAGVTSGDSSSILRAFTCQSIVEVDGTTGEILRNAVAQSERAMFDRFLSEVRKD